MAKQPKPKLRGTTRWNAFLMRGKRADPLGDVTAPTEAEAIAKACVEYGITADWQKQRVFVRRQTE